ncbi:MAG TPA: preprotein translocase subunit Sec61beta [Candidatus Nanoarchaeia archaeon]|nr:preprotein translocase subunit Sec61beta [Candidatus Nanoarchaeia archaeon]
MADNRVQMPSGMGGLIRYSDETKSKLIMKPEVVVALILFVIVIEVVLHLI